MMFACTDNLDYVDVSNQTTRAYVDEDSVSLTNPTLIDDWENVSTIILSNPLNGGLPQQVTPPWANGSLSNLSTEFKNDILKENGWKMLFHTFQQLGKDPEQNYMCFYNQLTGYIKVFYYYEDNVPATNALWYIAAEDLQKTKLFDETEYLSVGNDSVPLTNIIIASNMGIGPLAGFSKGWNGFEFQVPYSNDYSNKYFTINAYNQIITGFDLSGKLNLETIGTIVTKNTSSTTSPHIEAIANVSGDMTKRLINNLADTTQTKSKFGEALEGLLTDIVSGNVKGLLKEGLNLIFGKTSSTTTYNSDVKLSTAGTITMSGDATTETTSSVAPISLKLYETINSATDDGHFLGVWRLKKNPTIKQGRIMLFNSPDIIQGSATSSFVTLRGTVQFPPMKVENVEVEINPDLEPYVTNVATTTSILYCDSLQGSAYKSGVREARYLENGTRLLYSDEFNHFREITPGEDRMTLTINYQKENNSDPLPNTYFYDWGDPTDGRILLVVDVEITYNYQGKEIVVNQSRTYAPTYIVDESYGTRPHHVHYPPHAVIVNYNQPYLD